MRGTSVVVGASGGIGGALAAALALRGDRVLAASRSGRPVAGAFLSLRLDVTDEDSIAEAGRIAAEHGPVDLVIVATGILHEPDLAPEKTFRALDGATLARLMAVNAIGPALVAKHFLPFLPRRGRSVFAALSARVGSIGDNRLGGWYGYRASKAALNQIVRTLATEIARTRPDALALALHPGTVATALSAPFRDPDGPGLVTPSEAARNILDVIDRAAPEHSGRLLAWDGSVVPP